MIFLPTSSELGINFEVKDSPPAADTITFYISYAAVVSPIFRYTCFGLRTEFEKFNCFLALTAFIQYLHAYCLHYLYNGVIGVCQVIL